MESAGIHEVVFNNISACDVGITKLEYIKKVDSVLVNKISGETCIVTLFYLVALQCFQGLVIDCIEYVSDYNDKTQL